MHRKKEHEANRGGVPRALQRAMLRPGTAAVGGELVYGLGRLRTSGESG